MVCGSVEETLNGLLEAETEKLTQAAKYERSEEQQGYRSGHYSRNLTTVSGDVALNVPRFKGILFETAIIKRYRRRESSVEEALIEMYLVRVSVRRVEDINLLDGMNKKEKAIAAFMRANPQVTNKALIARVSGASRNTVVKYYAEIRRTIAVGQ